MNTLLDSNVGPFLIAELNPDWEILVFESESHIVNRAENSLVKCNSQAAAIGLMFDGRSTVSEIAASLAARYDIDPHSTVMEIIQVIIQLHSMKVVSFKGIEGIQQRLKLFASLPASYLKNTESKNPFDYFDAIFCINMLSDTRRWNEMSDRFAKLGILDRVIQFAAVETPISHHIGCTLAHRQLVSLAKTHGLNNILVFEDDALMLDSLLEHLPSSINDLDQFDWNLFYLGGCLRIDADRDIIGVEFLKTAKQLTCTHAVAYSARCFDQVLNDIPSDIIGLLPWLKDNAAIDQYLTNRVDHGYLAFPTLSAQRQTLGWEQPHLKNLYT